MTNSFRENHPKRFKLQIWGLRSAQTENFIKLKISGTPKLCWAVQFKFEFSGHLVKKGQKRELLEIGNFLVLFDKVLWKFAILCQSSVIPRRRSSNLVCSCFPQFPPMRYCTHSSPPLTYRYERSQIAFCSEWVDSPVFFSDPEQQRRPSLPAIRGRHCKKE